MTDSRTEQDFVYKHPFRFEVGQVVRIDPTLGPANKCRLFLIVDRSFKYENRVAMQVERYLLEPLEQCPGFENDLLLVSSWQIELVERL